MTNRDINILIIDDDSDILFALSAICDYKGWNAVTANSVKEGIREFKRNRIDIVLIDYHMPVVNGIVGVRQIRELSKTTPIIVLTVEEKQEIADEFMDSGASDFALKPIKAPDLIARINVHLRWVLDNKSGSYREYAKGINNATLDIVEDYMSGGEVYTISQISKDTSLAYQTVHRYLKHLIEHNMVEVDLAYGKVGRPTQVYRWL